jgi:polysaccharide export outer membrane protein
LAAVLGVGLSLYAQEPPVAEAEAPDEEPALPVATPLTPEPLTPEPEGTGQGTEEGVSVSPGDVAPISAQDFEQTIAAGDVVRVSMFEDPEVKYEGEVSASGTIPIPYYGEFLISGLSEKGASEKLSAALEEGLYQRATVAVVLVSKGPGTVYIYGAVGSPGAVSIPKYGRLSILRLILLSGGLSAWSAPEDTFILRRSLASGSIERLSVNLREIFASAIPQSEEDLPLMDGDIVCIPGLNGELHQFMSAEDREIIIVGEVGSPGPINFRPGEMRSLMRALFKAGGFTQFAKKSAIRIIRYEKNQERSEMVVDAEEIMDEGLLHKDIELQPGDMLIVPAKRVNF